MVNSTTSSLRRQLTGLLTQALVSAALAFRLYPQSPGSISADRARLDEITGAATPLRACPLVTSLVPALRRASALDSLAVCGFGPDIRTVWNSEIPFTLNDGPLWAGRGWNLSVAGGVGLMRRFKGVTVTGIAAPMLVYSENLPFQIISGAAPGRSAYSNPFHAQPYSLDLPLRFGDRHLLSIDPGRSSLDVRTRRVAVGITADNEWWGPAIRNALVMSNNAAGIPRLYVSTPGAVRTRIGRIDAKLIAGSMTESHFFDVDPGNDYRAISGLHVTVRPAFDSSLTLGFSRVVYLPISDNSPLAGVLAHSLDALARWEPLADPFDTAGTGALKQHSDQIIGVSARWAFTSVGFEVYGEWARMDLPWSLTEFLAARHHTGGFTLGLQWVTPSMKYGRLRLQAEATDLEQSQVFINRPPPDFYVGRAALQGYTQRGQPIGAGIGPGASSQFIALDDIARVWQGGVYLGRIRWENDAMYRQQFPVLFGHDVTIFAGIRGARRTRWTDIAVDATIGYRYNYLFQNGFAQPDPYPFRTVDKRNLTISTSITPR